MQIHTLIVTPFQQNARILVDPSSNTGALVDPGGDLSRILKEVDRIGVDISKVLLTHAHIDHAGAVQQVLDFSIGAWFGLCPHRVAQY